MPIEIPMPRLSDTMEEGTLVKWKVKVGDTVKSGDVLADVETDKATMELQSYDDGKVAKLAAEEGQTVAVGQLLLTLAKPGESLEEAAKATAGSAPAAPRATEKPSAAAAPAGDEAEEAVAAPGGAKIRVSPLARKIAEERGLDLATIKGSGPDGRIIKRDVLTASGGGTSVHPAPGTAPGTTPGTPAALAKSPAAPPAAPQPTFVKLETRIVPVSNMRKTIARRLLESKTSIPHFTVTVTVNMDPLLALRATLNQQLESQGVKLSVNDFIVRASALALLRHPFVNSSWTDAGIQQHGTINIGVAVSLPPDKGGGLVVPTLRDVQNKGLRTISSETRALADKARTQGLSLEEMSDGTFTISNLGMMGVDHFEAIINPPQAAILAVGAAVKRPVVRNDQVAIGSEMTCTLSADHRVIDGAMAAEFLQTLKQMLENPATLLV